MSREANELPHVTYRSASTRAAAFDQALREAMSTPITDTVQAQDSSAADPAARTAGPEGVAVERVTTHPAVLDSGAEPYDDDRVNHALAKSLCPYCADLSQWDWLGICDCFATDAPYEVEHVRQARLRRFQAVDPRERRAD